MLNFHGIVTTSSRCDEQVIELENLIYIKANNIGKINTLIEIWLPKTNVKLSAKLVGNRGLCWVQPETQDNKEVLPESRCEGNLGVNSGFRNTLVSLATPNTPNIEKSLFSW